MDVYELYPDYKTEYRRLTMPDSKFEEFLRRFDGTPMKRPCTDVTIQWEPESGARPKGDYPHLTLGLPVFSSRAIGALGDLLEGNGEILPTTCEGEQVFFFNVTNVIDALDESNSEVERYDGGGVMHIEKYAFVPEKVIGCTIFKIPQFPIGPVFVTDPFVERVKATRLKGFWFPRVWSTDKMAVIDWVW